MNLLKVLSLKIHRSLIAGFGAAALFAASGCSLIYDKSSDDELPDNETTSNVFLTLNVATTDAPKTQNLSRAVDDLSYFELPVYECEKLATLRVIILGAGNVVEGNRLVSINELGQPANADDLTFQVPTGRKVIYLFGNETSLPADFQTLISSITLNETLTPAKLAQINNATIARESGKPVLDLSDESSPLRVPMSERWEVTAHRPSQLISSHQFVNLFITRALTKFSFIIRPTYDYYGTGTISSIAFNSLSSSQYILPQNAVYNPAKGVESDNPYRGRFIESFDAPQLSSGSQPYFFHFPEPVDLVALHNKGETYTYSPRLYFTETKLSTPDNFRCRISIDGVEYSSYATLPNLSQLPRNTHVVVIITVGNNNVVDCTVEVVPYIGVVLDPIFGFIELDPNPSHNN